jgi:hypothetical protein
MEQLISSADPAIAFKQHALTLVKGVAGQVKPDPKPVAIETTIRQLDRYCMWWTQANGFFPGAASDLSLPAAELSKSACMDGTDRRVVGGADAAFSDHAGSGMIGLAGLTDR